MAGRGGVLGDASAVALNVTAVDPGGAGYVTVWPCGSSQPNASSLNFEAHQTIPNLVIAKLGSGGRVCVYTSAATHLLADLEGQFSASTPLRAITPACPLDTAAGPGTVDGQQGGQGVVGAEQVVELSLAGRGPLPSVVPQTVALNVTVTGTVGAGYVTVWPCGQAKPNASSLNFPAGATIANLVLATPGVNGKVCVSPSQAGTHLIVDVAAFAPSGCCALGDPGAVRSIPVRVEPLSMGSIRAPGLLVPAPCWK